MSEQDVLLTAYVTCRPGFFGPKFHAYMQCSDEATTPESAFMPIQLTVAAADALDESWLCWKCGDALRSDYCL